MNEESSFTFPDPTEAIPLMPPVELLSDVPINKSLKVGEYTLATIVEPSKKSDKVIVRSSSSKKLVTFNSTNLERPIIKQPKIQKINPLAKEVIDFAQQLKAKDVTDQFILTHLKGLIEVYGPMVNNDLYPRGERYLKVEAESKPIPYHERNQLAKICGTTPAADSRKKPLFGFVLYIGSPADGEMILYNEILVNQWIQFSRAAIDQRLIQAEGDVLSAAAMAKLVTVLSIPGDRHSFEIKYEQPEDGVNFQGKSKWTSKKYPCTITSCRL